MIRFMIDTETALMKDGSLILMVDFFTFSDIIYYKMLRKLI